MRTQIDLESGQHALAKRKAVDLGISMAEYIRRLMLKDFTIVAADTLRESSTGVVPTSCRRAVGRASMGSRTTVHETVLGTGNRGRFG